MYWFNGKRFDDHLHASEKLSEEVNKKIDDLIEQNRLHDERVRAEFRRMQDNIEERHSENRKRIWAVALIILGAILTNYLAQHGLTAPGF